MLKKFMEILCLGKELFLNGGEEVFLRPPQITSLIALLSGWCCFKVGVIPWRFRQGSSCFPGVCVCVCVRLFVRETEGKREKREIISSSPPVADKLPYHLFIMAVRGLHILCLLHKWD